MSAAATPVILRHQSLTLEKRVPLTISRGTQSHSEMLWVRIAADGWEGWGEAVAFSVDGVEQTMAQILASMGPAQEVLSRFRPLDRTAIASGLLAAGVPSAARAAIDQALWDWHGRSVGQSVTRLWELKSDAGPMTSVTIGISEPEAAQRRVRLWLELGDLRAFKIKLGAPAGIAADQRMFEAVAEVLPAGAEISVDANGGWSAEDARTMAAWLAARGVMHIEQPLPRGEESRLPELRRHSPLPVVLDESIFTTADIASLAGLGALDGINIKLMKCGGLTEALGLVRCAREHGLKILVGCYGNSALSNTAAAHLGPLVDYLDLDSHLNLKNDPFTGARLEAGRLVLPGLPGFGVSHVQH